MKFSHRASTNTYKMCRQYSKMHSAGKILLNTMDHFSNRVHLNIKTVKA